MQPYEKGSGESGVRYYQTGSEYIIVQFKNGDTYKYTYKSASRKHIETMKKLAKAGEGLSTYISQHTHHLYEAKL